MNAEEAIAQIEAQIRVTMKTPPRSKHAVAALSNFAQSVAEILIKYHAEPDKGKEAWTA